jgi:hypothetical protein
MRKTNKNFGLKLIEGLSDKEDYNYGILQSSCFPKITISVHKHQFCGIIRRCWLG